MTVLWSPDSAATPQHGADKYHGAVATGYDAKRVNDPKWTIEQAIIESMLDGIPAGNWVLDIPVGTGRFLQAYAKRKLLVRAYDKSAEMLQQAASKWEQLPEAERPRVYWAVRDIRALPLQDKSVDVSVACRITRWLSPDECRQAWAELGRVTRQRIIFTARIANHPHARPLDLFAIPGWKIARDEAGYEPDYRIVAMEPT